MDAAWRRPAINQFPSAALGFEGGDDDRETVERIHCRHGPVRRRAGRPAQREMGSMTLTGSARIRTGTGARRGAAASPPPRAGLALRQLLLLGGAAVAAAPVALLGAWMEPWVAAAALASGLAVAAAASWWLARRVAAPLREMAEAARRVGAGRFEARARQPGPLEPEELRALDRAFDAMAGEIGRRRAALAAAAPRAEAAHPPNADFHANMSHELRTPLNAIIGFSEVMQAQIYGPIANDKYLSYLGDIHGSGQHLLTMINEILDLAKAESGRMEVQYATVAVPDVIAQALRMVRGRAEAKSITLIADVPSHMPAIESDELKLRQVLINLLSNAVKFTDEGGAVNVSAGADAAGVWLRVSDTGIGIAPSDLNRVLEPFCQAEHVQERHREGTGLGLPLARKLVELMGGSFALSSDYGVGTKIEICLPWARTRSAARRAA